MSDFSFAHLPPFGYSLTLLDPLKLRLLLQACKTEIYDSSILRHEEDIYAGKYSLLPYAASGIY
jgi:hypothetical protein